MKDLLGFTKKFYILLLFAYGPLFLLHGSSRLPFETALRTCQVNTSGDCMVLPRPVALSVQEYSEEGKPFKQRHLFTSCCLFSSTDVRFDSLAVQVLSNQQLVSRPSFVPLRI